MTEKVRQIATQEEIEVAIEALDTQPVCIRICNWPAGLHGIDLPGLYSWWVDKEGLRQLELALGVQITNPRIYAGQAGATQWLLSGKPKYRKVTLSSRIKTRHLGLRCDHSTLRHTLAALLHDRLNLVPIGGKRLDQYSEKKLSDWIRNHLLIAVYPFHNRDVLCDLESQVLDKLDPPLNLKGRPSNAIRDRLICLRKAI